MKQFSEHLSWQIVFVFAVLVLLLFKLGTNLSLREMNKSYLLLILAGLYFCAPSFAITTIWLTGACNYLWICTLIVLFLFMFTRDSVSKLLMALLGLIAGWSIEPGAAVSIYITFVLIILAKREKKLKPHIFLNDSRTFFYSSTLRFKRRRGIRAFKRLERTRRNA